MGAPFAPRLQLLRPFAESAELPLFQKKSQESLLRFAGAACQLTGLLYSASRSLAREVSR